MKKLILFFLLIEFSFYAQQSVTVPTTVVNSGTGYKEVLEGCSGRRLKR